MFYAENNTFGEPTMTNILNKENRSLTKVGPKVEKSYYWYIPGVFDTLIKRHCSNFFLMDLTISFSH